MSVERSLISCFLILVNLQIGFAQNINVNGIGAALSGIGTYTTKDGLPSKNTTATIKDKRGFLWVGTENGLCRFDGYTFKVFSNISRDPKSISNNYVNALVEDKRGQIWVATMDGLNVLDPLSETFKRYAHRDGVANSLSNNKVWSVLCDKAGIIWVGTDDGFNRYLSDVKGFVNYRPNPSKSGSMVGKSVNAIIEDNQQNLYLGNWSGGLNKFNKKTERFTNYSQYHKPGKKNPNDVWALSYSPGGNIYVGTYWNGLFEFNPKTETFSKMELPDRDNLSVFSILSVRKDLILVGGNNGFYWHNTVTKSWNKIPDVQNSSFGDSYKDSDGIIWINARNGLRKLDDKQYKFSLNALPIGNREVKSVAVKNSIIWLGTNNGLFRIDPRDGRIKTFAKNANPNSITSNEISKLYFDHSGTLWILTENGFDSYDEHNNRFEHHYHHSSIGNLFNEDVFRDIIEIEDGVYLLATDAGIKIFNHKENTFTHYYNQANNPKSINNNHTYCLSLASDGKVWIGTYGGGINIFDRKTSSFRSIETTHRNNMGLSSNVVWAMYTDAKQNIWMCTPNGLNLYTPGSKRFQVFSREQGFNNTVFNDVTEDDKGTMWLATENGISSLDAKTKKVRNFDEAEGMLVSSVIVNDGSEIIVAGNKGYLKFNPSHIEFNHVAPSVYLTDFQLFNKSVSPDAGGPLKENLNLVKEITLNYVQSVFSIEFVALNFASPWKNQYAYRLIGFDKKWNYVGNQRKATYTNLSPGTYKFQVKASNNDGVWNNDGRVLIIHINPPWYMSWWAFLFYGIIILAAFYIYVKYRRKQEELRYEIKIAHIEGEKEKELNERKLSFFTNISHEFRTPLTLIINPVKELLYKDDKNLDTSSMNIVYRNAKRLLSLVDQLLLFRKADSEGDTLKASGINLVSLAKEVFLCFSHQAKSMHIEYVFSSTKDELEVYVDREKMEIAIFNLLSNAFKFTPERGRISLEIQEGRLDAQIIVTDSGCGIPDESKNKIFNRFYQQSDKSASFTGGFGIGLYLVKNFVEMHGGSIDFQSEEGKGTSFRIELLKGIGHIHPDHITQGQQMSSQFLSELNQDDISLDEKPELKTGLDEMLSQEKKSILVVDDNEEIASYLSTIFSGQYFVMMARDGESALSIVREFLPDIVISDVMMQGIGGIELCSIIKEDESISHIPVVLLTSSTSAEIKLKGVESGADDYISKPFDKELLMARIAGILKSKNSLQKYFHSEITLNPGNSKISSEHKDFLKNCITIVERNIEDPHFNIKMLAEEIGMSRTNLFNRIKSISGHSSNSFIRFIRLKKAAEIFISTDKSIQETMYMVGMNDIKYFREQFRKIFEMNPSDYIKKYRQTYAPKTSIDPELKKARSK